MKRYFILLALFAIELCFGQVPGEKYYNKEIGWTIQLPAGYENVSDAESLKREQSGLNMIEGTVGMDLEGMIDPVTTLFLLDQGAFNSFEANLQDFDPLVDGDFEEINRGVADIALQTFQTQLQGVEVDMNVTNETIAGKKFLLAKYTIQLPDNMQLYMYMYTTLLGKKSLTVNIMYMEEESGKILLDALKNSTFN